MLSPLLLLLGGGAGLAALADPVVLLLAVGVGVLSSVVPYVLDQIVLRRVGQARFAVLLALLPATATIVGLSRCAQVPSPLEAVGIAAVVGAVALRSRDGDPAGAAGLTVADDHGPCRHHRSPSVVENPSVRGPTAGWVNFGACPGPDAARRSHDRWTSQQTPDPVHRIVTILR